MRREYEKLVRDKMPEIIREDGGEPEIKELSEEKKYWALRDKLIEEVDEYLDDSDPGELVDILEVVDSLREYHHLTCSELREMKDDKIERRGAFEEGYYLEAVDIKTGRKFTNEK